MNPAPFKESNRTLRKPDSMTDEECGSLDVFTDGKVCISCWQLSFAERIQLLLFGRLWLCIVSGPTQPPVWLRVCKTVFVKEK